MLTVRALIHHAFFLCPRATEIWILLGLHSTVAEVCSFERGRSFALADLLLDKNAMTPLLPDVQRNGPKCYSRLVHLVGRDGGLHTMKLASSQPDQHMRSRHLQLTIPERYGEEVDVWEIWMAKTERLFG